MIAAPVPAQELRALLVYATLPPGCVVQPVADASLAPHLRPGEFAIVDPADRDLIPGELYHVAWTGGPDRDGRERGALCQAYRRDHVHDGRPFSAWWVGSMRNRFSPETTAALVRENQWDRLGWSNGPYRAGILEQQVRGRVVGILAPPFEGPKRLSNGRRAS